jgi:tRNA G18 (ribose-2'-O)-methylase SpoU
MEDGSRRVPGEVFLAPRNLLEDIVGYRLHQGIMAVGRVPPEPSLSQLTEGSARPLLMVALDGLMNSENVGVVVRNCAAFGANAVLVGETSASPYLRRAVRNSMGAVFHLPVMHSRNLARTLQELKPMGVTIIGTDLRGITPIGEADFRADICLAFGSEESGLSDEVLERCDARVVIPMQSQTDSLNVSSASAAFLYEVRRQRKPHPG